MSGIREILLLFPSTFEHFFEFYEVARLRWDPRRLSRRLLLRAAEFIWIVIKLPQEYILHIAQTDLTERIKGNIFGVDVTVSWVRALANRPLVIVALAGPAAALVLRSR